MGFNNVKSLLSSGILEKITSDEAAFKTLTTGTTEDVLNYAKANGIKLDPEQAEAAQQQLKKIAEASTMLDASGGQDDCVSNW